MKRPPFPYIDPLRFAGFAGRFARIWAVGWLLLLFLPAVGLAQALPGDFNGDGSVSNLDAALLLPLYESAAGDPSFDRSADLNDDDSIDLGDLALFGAGFGAAGSADATPPELVVSLNDVPDDMNDLLVVPPDGFQITLTFNPGGHSLIDPGSLSITSDQDIGSIPAQTELAGQFQVTPIGAVWEIPVGSDLARTSHFLTVSIRDVAGNQSDEVYGFAVRDFDPIPPLEEKQWVFLDFLQDRSGTPEIDFVEDLRAYGLSSAADPSTADLVFNILSSRITKRARKAYGRGGPGTPLNIRFDNGVLPGQAHSRLCVGGSSSKGPLFLGNAVLDSGNVDKETDDCDLGSQFGVFPQAIKQLWGGDPAYIAIFSAVDPDLGGIPVGEHPHDATLLASGLVAAPGSPEEARLNAVLAAADAFAQIVAVAVAHEAGHMLGLTEPGPAPGGLFGGIAGGTADHNETPSGSVPAVNYIMNPGASFSFESITGRGGFELPRFRALSRAYLENRIVLNGNVTGLFAAPEITSVTPDPVNPEPTAVVTIHGSGFLATPLVVLEMEGEPTPSPLLAVSLIDSQTITGVVNKFLVAPGVYDVRLVNPDDQEIVLVDALEVQ